MKPNVIKVQVKDLPKQDFSKTTPVRKYCQNLLKQGVNPNSRVEFFREARPDEFDFAVTNLKEYLNEKPLSNL